MQDNLQLHLLIVANDLELVMGTNFHIPRDSRLILTRQLFKSVAKFDMHFMFMFNNVLAGPSWI